ncbi:MAG TPA: shikimate kinase [Candidatus Dormibacteraeota bacterium]|jgi:shikimate kinase|nr:shikimate kinase [Candidatus Dormibacteraeota bacterium]
MGCGKSVVGVLVAKRAGAPFHDLDLEIESEAGMSIAEIFETKGEAAFRAMESRLLPELLQPGSVVALGGGAPIDEANWNVIVERSTTVFIDCGFDTIWSRIKDGTTRPLMAGRSQDELEALLAQRRPRYMQAVHRVEGDRPEDVVAEEILSLWSD